MSTPVTDDVVLDELTDSSKPCECASHPDDDPCDEPAVYAVRVRHMQDCERVDTPLLCQECLDDHLELAEELIGAICTECGWKMHAVEDMVGPVIPV